MKLTSASMAKWLPFVRTYVIMRAVSRGFASTPFSSLMFHGRIGQRSEPARQRLTANKSRGSLKPGGFPASRHGNGPALLPSRNDRHLVGRKPLPHLVANRGVRRRGDGQD